MISKITDGGPAFPKSLDPYPNTQGTTRNSGVSGMSLRDWFAGQALASFVPDTPQNKAEAAYAIADAMLAERARTGGNP